MSRFLIVAPGQFAVFYKGDYIYAAGQIDTVTLLYACILQAVVWVVIIRDDHDPR